MKKKSKEREEFFFQLRELGGGVSSPSVDLLSPLSRNPLLPLVQPSRAQRPLLDPSSPVDNGAWPKSRRAS